MKPILLVGGVLLALSVLSSCESSGGGKKASVFPDCVQIGSFPNAISSGHVGGGVPHLTATASRPFQWAYGTRIIQEDGRNTLTLDSGVHAQQIEPGVQHLAGFSDTLLWNGIDAIYEVTSSAVLARSDDLGENWVEDLALPFEVISLAGTFTVPDAAVFADRVIVWKSVTSDLGGYRAAISEDRGESFTELTMPPIDSPQMRYSIQSGAIGATGRVALIVRTDLSTTAQLWVTSDNGTTWQSVKSLPKSDFGSDLAVGTDGRLWLAYLDDKSTLLFSSTSWSGFTGGYAGTDVHPVVASDEKRPVRFRRPLVPQANGRMGFLSDHGRPPGSEDTTLLGSALCVVGDDTEGRVVPDIHIGRREPAFTAGKLEVAMDFPSAGYASVVDGSLRILTHEIDGSFDAMHHEVYRDGALFFDTTTMDPSPLPLYLVPANLARSLVTGLPLLVTRAVEGSSDDAESGTIWELADDASVARQWTIGLFPNSTAVEPHKLVTGPADEFIYYTSGGVFYGSFTTPSGTGGPMAFNSAGEVFYGDGDWLARAPDPLQITAGRCAAATVDTLECIHFPPSFHIGYFSDVVVAADGTIYLAGQRGVYARPSDTPTSTWTLAADGFANPTRLQIGQWDGQTLLWIHDDATLWAGTLGGTLPLTR